MKTYLECIPCLVRQTFEAVTFATADEKIREETLQSCLQQLSQISTQHSPPYMSALIHRIIKEKTGCIDPYAQIRKDSNTAALQLYPEMKRLVAESAQPLQTAINLAIFGNIIDSGAPNCPPLSKLPELLRSAAEATLHGGAIGEFLEKLQKAKQILILGDNAGEIVCDRVLLEELGPERCCYVVRGKPILNDSVYADAVQAGITEKVEVIDNGSDAPGTVLEWCSETFLERYHNAELIISKGQGNFESLSGNSRPGIFFLLRAKCPVIAGHIDCEIGNHIVTTNC